jgi:putative nucleotidyltransferase with HDIG domain
MKLSTIKRKKILLVINRSIQVLVAAALIVLITPTKSSFKYEFQLGHYWKHDNLISPFDFAINKSESEINNEKKEINSNKKLYFDYSEQANTKMLQEVEKDVNSEGEKDNLSNKEIDRLNFIAKKILIDITSHGILSEYKSSNNKNSDYTIVVIENNLAQEHEIGEYYSIKDIEEVVNEEIEKNYPNKKANTNRNLLADILTKTIYPNIIYNSNKTDEILQAQIDDISPTKGLISKDEKIISKGELITMEKYQILSSLKSEYEGSHSGMKTEIASTMGQYLLIVIAMMAMVLFVYNTDKDIFLNNKKIILIFTVILLMVGMTVGVLHIDQKYLYVVPLCLTPILIRTFFDTKVSLYVFLVSIIIIGFSVPNSFEFVFYQLIAGMMAILSVEHLEKRSEFFNTGVVVFATYSLIYIAMTLIQDANLKQLDVYRFIYFAANAIMILFAFPFVFVLEKIFGLVSEISLMEYANTNSKILRELSIKAPGTFQHSIQVANIAEDLIHEIGGNALLVRVGCLYHDIGKIMSPMFFIENQNTDMNPHNEITNEESAQIIISHVTNGIKLAHRYKIPEPIVDFIRTHHGTSKTKYFYNKQKNEFPDIPIDENMYTYNGPRPFSKETAVVMMVDSVEAASRSLKEHNEKAISNLVDNIISAQIADNQYANANITFADIDKIKKVLKKKLQSIYHVRIEYPVIKSNK